MSNVDFFSISMYQIQRFLAVAELSSFTKAAQKLNIAQPVISKSIAQLENNLELILFIRDKGTVRLTPAGRYLREFWGGILPVMEQSIEKAHTVQSGVMGQLTIGIHNIYDISPFFIPIVSRFREKYPLIKLYTKCYSFPDLRSRVNSGYIDLAFTSRFESDNIRVLESERFQVREVLEFPLRAIMLTTNPLAQKEKVSVSDLRYQRFIIHTPSKVPAYQRLIVDMCRPYGFVPMESEYVEDATSFVLSLSENDQVFVVDRAAKLEDSLPLKGYDLEGTKSGVSLIWRQGPTDPLLDLFLEECDKFFEENPDPFTEK
ncbi:MAG: LysR family transcriptional regulator [Oscillospiraceae bacterium]|nr:LysR family transcriptional regulator [Oscillospiraceae bacterium]